MKNIWEGKTESAKYNIKEFCKDQNMSIAEFAARLNLRPSTIYRSMEGKRLVKWTLEKINNLVEESTNFPETYLLSRVPYIISARGRKDGSKNKNSSVREISIEEYIEKKVEPQVVARKQIKTYLTNEEIFSALANGETVYQENSTYSYQMLVESNCSIVLKFRDNKPIFLNCAIDLSSSYYILKKEKLSINVGKKYRNKRGDEVTIFAQDDEKLFKGVITGDCKIYTYNSEGVNQFSDLETTLYDLDEELI